MEFGATSGPNATEVVVTKDSCRVCMSRNTKMENIFDSGPNGIIDRILYCTGVQFTEHERLPSQICISCLEHLSIAHKFKTACVLADVLYHKTLVNGLIKTEKAELNDDENQVINDDNFDDELHFDDDEAKVKDEILEEVLKQTGLRKTRVRLKKTKNQSTIEINTAKPRKKRGPYNKTQGKPKRLRKLKFTRLKCEPCDIKFTTKEESDAHKKLEHKDSETWICEICGKVFVHRASHYTHIRSHLPPQYGCEQCDYKTWHKYDLVKHIRIHTGIKQYQCEFCTSSFHTSSNLSGHIRRFHEGQKPFECHMCSHRFFDRTKLNRHLDSHNDVKRFECEICHSCFTRRCYWKKHLQRQHGVLVPAQRPGRQKVNLLIGECLGAKAPSVFSADSGYANGDIGTK